MNVTVASVELVRGNDTLGCTTCSEQQWVIWNVRVEGRSLTEVRCSLHASNGIFDEAEGAAFAASAVKATVTTGDLADDLVDGIVHMLETIPRPDLAYSLAQMWGAAFASISHLTPIQQLAKARFIIGSAAFALLPSMPIAGDEDDCHEPVFDGDQRDCFPVIKRGV